MQTKKIDFLYPQKLEPVIGNNKRNIVLYGGRGGAKSWFVAAYLVALSTTKKNQIILCTREVQNTIKDSVHKLLSDTILRLGLFGKFNILKNEIICTNGSRFIFKGLRHSIGEIKSTEGINYCWVEEAQKISRDSIDVLWPTVRSEESQFFLTFNPDDSNDPVYNDFIINNRDNSLVININYFDNPFFPEVLKMEMEYDKEFNYDKYLHVWEGGVKEVTEACIFKDKFTVDNFETHQGVDFYYGADWGFSQDPSCITRCYVHDDYLYIDREAGGVGIEMDELPQLWDSIPDIRSNKVIADNARPETISFMNSKGFVVRSSKKGSGSIQDGIEFMRSFKKIIIHDRCKNTAYEFKSYSYKKDRLTNEILKIIIDKDNHYIDSIRYGLEDLRKFGRKIKAASVSAASLGI